MSQPASTPFPAATVLMLRQRSSMEVFMVVRHHQIDFASGALVFPGGKVDQADFDPALASRLDAAHADPALRTQRARFGAYFYDTRQEASHE